MSDFLTSLVTRSFKASPVIRPRVTSLFEPVRGGPTSLHDIVAGNNQDRIEMPEEEVIAADPESRKPVRGERSLAANDQTEIRGADQVVASSISAHSTQPARELERNPITERVIEKHETRTLSGEIRHVDAAANAVPRSLIADAPSWIQKNPALPDGTSLPQFVRPAEKEKPAQLISPKITPQMPVADLALRMQPQRRHEGEFGFRREASRTSEPTVHVTIGRIEVRAVKENAQPTRSASASPVMSLDEYLRKRGQRVTQ